LIEEYKNTPGVTGYTFKMESQKWLDESIYYVQNHGNAVWTHWVTIWVPKGKRVDQEWIF
jgi:hypothetical protein